jgi:predicted ATP-grasp superfamily ATP-dependent carboligase
LVYEYTCSAGGQLTESLQDTLLAEGRAMLVGLATDLIAASQHTLIMWNERLGNFPLTGANVVSAGPATDERMLLARYAREVDWTIVVAPETGGLLEDRCRCVEAAGGRLLGCSSSLVELLSDKHRTAEHLVANGVLAPRGKAWLPGEPAPALPCPAVVKPRDGAGALRAFLVEGTCDLHALLTNYKVPARIEEHVPGIACSVSFLCGPCGCCPLPPTIQRIDLERHCHEVNSDSHIRKIEYVGGRLPLPADLSERALELAIRAVRTLPMPIGYIGIDLVLGDREDGSRDFVIEVNPRLTTSYVGLRARARSNLAQAMLDVAAGRMASLSFNDQAIEFDADGTVRAGD